MDTKQCISIIYASADKYEEHLVNRNLLFIYQETPNKIAYMEATFRSYNFLHLTGIIFEKGYELTPKEFYESCLDRKLTPSHILLREDGTTEQKLNILPNLLNPCISAKMIGIYAGGRMNLLTERMTGGVRGSMGFIKDRGYYFPNTVINGDIRDNIDRPRRIIATFRKPVDNSEYNECTYLAKKVDLEQLSIPEPYGYLSKTG